MLNLSFWLNKAGFSLINRFVIFAFGFITYSLIVRHLSKEEFGIYSLYIVIVTISELALNSFIQNGFVKFYLDKNVDKNKVFASSLVLNIIMSSAYAILLFALSNYIAGFYGFNDFDLMLRIYCICLILNIPYSQVHFYLNAEADFKLISILSLVRSGTSFLIMCYIFIYMPEAGLIELVHFQVMTGVMNATISFVLFRKIQFSLLDGSLGLIKKLFHFGKYIFGVGITSIVTKSVDQLMIGFFISAEAVASYNLANRFTNFIEIPITSIAQAVYPKFAETSGSVNSKLEKGKIFEVSVGTMLAFISPFILILFLIPSFFITIVAGEKYINAIPILQILIVFNLLKPFATQAGAVLEVSGKPKIGFYALLITTVINIVMNYFMIQMSGPFGGIIGAALATSISGIVYVVIVLKAIHIESTVSLFETLKQFVNVYRKGFDILIKTLKKLNKD